MLIYNKFQNLYGYKVSTCFMEKSSDDCYCECHLGGAVSCPTCKKNHHEVCKCEDC